ncbi:MAG: ABC transporter substrate-binding protein [Elusimicrobia bacterium]|nr:ABC transporter substrate-binding protein [Elusimicrobiota bacterium]
MPERRNIFVLLISVLLCFAAGAAALFLSSCAGKKDSGKVIFRGAGSWEIPPAFHGNPWAPGGVGSASWYVHEPLFMFLPGNRQFLPRLGLSMKESKNHKKLTVKLREGVKWHDGHPFTSKDVVTTFIIGYLHHWAVWQLLEGIETPDEHTVVFRWKKPCPHLFKTRALIEKIHSPSHIYGKWAAPIRPLMKKEAEYLKFRKRMGYSAETRKEGAAFEIEKEKKAVREKLYSFKPVELTGTGPFKLVTVTASDMRFEKFAEGWAAGKIAIDEVQMARWPSNEIIWAFLIAGEIDAAHPATPKEVAEQIIKLNPRMKMVTPSDLAEFGLVFNLGREPMSDLEFRRAVATAIDRDLVRKISYYYGTPVTAYSLGIIKSQRSDWLSPETLQKWEKYEFNPQKAEEILLAAGYKRNAKGFWLTPEGKKINLEISTLGNSDFVLGADSISSQLVKFGIDCHVRIVMGQLYGTKLTSGDFDMVTQFLGDARRYGDPATVFENILGKGGYISTACRFPEEVKGPDGKTIKVHKLAKELREYLPEPRRREIIRTLSWVVNKYLPILPVYEKNMLVFITEGKRVSGWPDESHPMWSAVSTGMEGVYISFMTEGLLKGKP